MIDKSFTCAYNHKFCNSISHNSQKNWQESPSPAANLLFTLFHLLL